ncbi:MAG: O-antigen ligase family protein [Desulfobacterales bacterium]
MLDLSTLQYVQITAALLAAQLVFILGYIYPRLMVGFLIVTLPFQVVDSQYGSINVALIYMTTLSAFVSRKISIRQAPLMFPVILALWLVTLVYIVALFNNPTPMLVHKVTYLIGFFSNVALLFLIYATINTESDIHHFLKLLLIVNILILGYCTIQFFAGFKGVVPFGIKEFAFIENRLHEGIDERRLMGPFLGAGLLAEYFALMQFIHGYTLFTTGRRKIVTILVMFGNFCAMVGTGNRGAPIALTIGCLICLYVFRKTLSFNKVFKISSFGIGLLLVASFLMINFTQFNVLYRRFVNTEIHGITPDTRGGWPEYIKKGMEAPLLGRGGVRMVLPSDLYSSSGQRRPGIPLNEAMAYPHSLYIYVFYTLGIFGLAVYSLLVITLYYFFFQVGKWQANNRFLHGLPKLATVLLTVFLIDQFKLEFLRHNYVDYQNIIFSIFGMFLAYPKVINNGAYTHDKNGS